MQVLDGGSMQSEAASQMLTAPNLRRASPEPGSILDRDRNQVLRRRLAPPLGVGTKVLSL